MNPSKSCKTKPLFALLLETLQPKFNICSIFKFWISLLSFTFIGSKWNAYIVTLTDTISSSLVLCQILKDFSICSLIYWGLNPKKQGEICHFYIIFQIYFIIISSYEDIQNLLWKKNCIDKSNPSIVTLLYPKFGFCCQKYSQLCPFLLLTCLISMWRHQMKLLLLHNFQIEISKLVYFPIHIVSLSYFSPFFATEVAAFCKAK